MASSLGHTPEKRQFRNFSPWIFFEIQPSSGGLFAKFLLTFITVLFGLRGGGSNVDDHALLLMSGICCADCSRRRAAASLARAAAAAAAASVRVLGL